MLDPNIKQTRDMLIHEYPDCPQRDMALQLLRRGHLEQAQAWIGALDDLRQNGQHDMLSDTLAKQGNAS